MTKENQYTVNHGPRYLKKGLQKEGSMNIGGQAHNLLLLWTAEGLSLAILWNN